MSEDTPISGSSSTTRFVCKVCGNTFSRRDVLNEHLAEAHHPKRTVTANDIINGVLKARSGCQRPRQRW